MTDQPLDLDQIETRAAHLYEYVQQTDEADVLAGTDVPAMADEIHRLRDQTREYGELAARRESELITLRDALEQIRHLHKDSPMGPCPVCIDADAAAAGGDGLVPYPCPTGRLAGAQDCDPPHVRANPPADTDEMAASLRRDGFGDNEIADMLGPGVTDGEAPEPTLLRWGLDDVMYGDDDSTIVMLSGPAGEPYWLELDPERTAVLRQNLAGPAAEETHVVADDSSGPEPTDRCGTRHYQHPDTVCTEPAGHYRPTVDPHAGPLILDGRECGGAAWDDPAAVSAASRQ